MFNALSNVESCHKEVLLKKTKWQQITVYEVNKRLGMSQRASVSETSASHTKQQDHLLNTREWKENYTMILRNTVHGFLVSDVGTGMLKEWPLQRGQSCKHSSLALPTME